MAERETGSGAGEGAGAGAGAGAGTGVGMSEGFESDQRFQSGVFEKPVFRTKEGLAPQDAAAFSIIHVPGNGNCGFLAAVIAISQIRKLQNYDRRIEAADALRAARRTGQSEESVRAIQDRLNRLEEENKTLFVTTRADQSVSHEAQRRLRAEIATLVEGEALDTPMDFERFSVRTRREWLALMCTGRNDGVTPENYAAYIRGDFAEGLATTATQFGWFDDVTLNLLSLHLKQRIEVWQEKPETPQTITRVNNVDMAFDASREDVVPIRLLYTGGFDGLASHYSLLVPKRHLERVVEACENKRARDVVFNATVQDLQDYFQDRGLAHSPYVHRTSRSRVDGAGSPSSTAPLDPDGAWVRVDSAAARACDSDPAVSSLRESMRDFGFDVDTDPFGSPMPPMVDLTGEGTYDTGAGAGAGAGAAYGSAMSEGVGAEF